MNFAAEDVFDAVRRGYSSLAEAHPDEITEYFSHIDDQSVIGHVNNIKGILFEQAYVEDLASQGVEAALFEAVNHPVSDVLVFGDLDVVTELQLKATDSASYIADAMMDDPESTFVVTSEVVAHFASDVVVDAGIENAALESVVEETLFSEVFNPFSAFSVLRFLLGVPF